MKTTTITTLLALGYLALGLSVNASTSNFKELHFPNDTNEISIEIDGVEAGAGLLEAITKIVAISTTEAAKLAEHIAEIEALVEAGTLTEEEGDARVKELTENFEQRMESFGESMETWGEEFGEKMEAWGEDFSKKWEDRAEELEKSIETGVIEEINIRDLDTEESDSLSVPLPKKKKSNKTQFNNFEFHLGANSFRTMNGNSTSTEDLLNHYESLTFRSAFVVKNKIGGAGSPLLISIGYELEGLAFSFKNDNTIVKVNQPSGEATTGIVPVTGVTDIRRNAFSQAFLTVPIMIELDFSPSGKVDKRLSLGFGGYAGVRIGSENILLGSDSEGDRIRISTNNNYNTHLFRYGLQGQVGIKSWKVTGRIDARTFFQENAFNEDVYAGSVTLGYAF
jgi:polyhydroxyalkanoate synthesis regulator phasin